MATPTITVKPLTPEDIDYFKTLSGIRAEDPVKEAEKMTELEKQHIRMKCKLQPPYETINKKHYIHKCKPDGVGMCHTPRIPELEKPPEPIRTYKVLKDEMKPYKIPYNCVARMMRDNQKKEWERHDTTDEATAERLTKKFHEEWKQMNARYDAEQNKEEEEELKWVDTKEEATSPILKEKHQREWLHTPTESSAPFSLSYDSDNESEEEESDDDREARKIREIERSMNGGFRIILEMFCKEIVDYLESVIELHTNETYYNGNFNSITNLKLIIKIMKKKVVKLMYNLNLN